VLSEAQQKLLVKSTEKKILPVQLKLVRKKKIADVRESLGRSSWNQWEDADLA
jgi:hypothetical protein